MITLTKATEAEFDRYRAFAESDEGPDRTTRQEIDHMLPAGLNTKNHHLLSLRSVVGQVGFLCMTVIDRKSEVEAFVLDLVVFPEFHRRGYAGEAIRELEEYVAELGLNRISLTVFQHNESARGLYEKSGYAPVFTRMTKQIGEPS